MNWGKLPAGIGGGVAGVVVGVVRSGAGVGDVSWKEENNNTFCYVYP